MPAPQDGKRVIGLANGGYTDRGLFIRFDVRFDDLSVQPMHCAYEDLGSVLTDLRMLGQTAEQARRATVSSQTLELSRGYRAIDTRTGSVEGSSDILIRFATPDGIPVDVAMSKELARKAIEGLTKAIAQAEKGGGRTN